MKAILVIPSGEDHGETQASMSLQTLKRVALSRSPLTKISYSTWIFRLGSWRLRTGWGPSTMYAVGAGSTKKGLRSDPVKRISQTSWKKDT